MCQDKAGGCVSTDWNFSCRFQCRTQGTVFSTMAMTRVYCLGHVSPNHPITITITASIADQTTNLQPKCRPCFCPHSRIFMYYVSGRTIRKLIESQAANKMTKHVPVFPPSSDPPFTFPFPALLAEKCRLKSFQIINTMPLRVPFEAGTVATCPCCDLNTQCHWIISFIWY